MKTGLILTIGSFGFLVLLLVSYALQKRTSTLGSKLYRLMISIILVLLVTEMIASYYFLYGGNKPEITSLLLRIHWYTGILWFWALYLYSICFLKDIKADILKIDMSFLQEIRNNERNRIILQSVISMAYSLGMDVITEGVETEEQLRILTEMGCNCFQGYFFSRPVPVEVFEMDFASAV